MAKKFDGSKNRGPGRPPIEAEIEKLIVRMAEENSGWGYDRIVGALAELGHEVFLRTLKDVGVKPLALPARSPNLNAHAERWVLSAKSECLDHLVLFGEKALRRALSEFERHYHRERPHQGVGNVLLFPKQAPQASSRAIKRRVRLGGLLSFYHRDAA